MIRGAVYPVDLGDAKRGHEQRGRRLGLVISIEQDAWSTVTIIPTSTGAQVSVFRPEVVVAGRATKLLIDQVRTIDVAYIAGELVDYLSRDDMAQVEYSLSRYFGLLRLRKPANRVPCRPRDPACGPAKPHPQQRSPGGEAKASAEKAVQWSSGFSIGASNSIKGVTANIDFGSTAQTGYDANDQMVFKFAHDGWICGTNHDPTSQRPPSGTYPALATAPLTARTTQLHP
jgi:mRNA interferase MazF